jgi:hypothetical protein
MQHNRAALEHDLAQQQRALRQTTDARRALIYQKTISRITQLLQQTPLSPEESAPPPVPQRRTPARSVNMAAPVSPTKTAHTSAPRSQTLTVSAVNIGSTPTVTIQWDINGEETADILTEGQCRGRFATMLRDLIESKRWEQGRLEDVKQSVTFLRAEGYYQALCKFWKRAPTMSELYLNHSRYSEVFQIVTNTTP